MWFMLFVRKFLFTVLINAFFFFFPVPPTDPPILHRFYVERHSIGDE